MKTPKLDPPSTSSTLAPETEGFSLKKKKRLIKKIERTPKKKTQRKRNTLLPLAEPPKQRAYFPQKREEL
jgi:hypothetical protein